MKSLFTPEELEEMKAADEEIERSYIPTKEELRESRERDRHAELDRLDNHGKKIAEQKAAYRAANREKIAEQQAAYYAANREKIAEQQAAYRAANLEKIKERRKLARNLSIYCQR